MDDDTDFLCLHIICKVKASYYINRIECITKLLRFCYPAAIKLKSFSFQGALFFIHTQNETDDLKGWILY